MDRGQGASGEAPYRHAPRGQAPTRTLWFAPQLRIYFAPIAWLVGLLALRGAWSTETWQDAYDRGFDCESTVSATLTVAYASCHVQDQTFPCADARARLHADLHPGVLVSNVRVIRNTRDEARLTFEEAEKALETCLPTPPPLVNPGSYLSGERRSAYLRIRGDDYTFAAKVSLLVLLVLLAFVPTRVVRIRLDATSGMLRVRDVSLLRRARATDCLLSDVEDVVEKDDRVAFVLRSGAALFLTDVDHRPRELRARTIRRARAWLAVVRADARQT